MKRRAGLLAAAIAVVAVISGCGTHPGAAAVVEGIPISVDTVDDAATAYCDLSLAQGSQPLSTADARRQALADLIAWTVATNVADEKGLDLDSAHWAVSQQMHEQITKTFDKSEVAGIEKVLKRTNQTQAIQTALGAAKTGSGADDAPDSAGTAGADADAAQQAGRDIILNALKSSGVSIDPRFGIDDDLNQVSATGSLSVAAAGEKQSATKMAQSQPCK